MKNSSRVSAALTSALLLVAISLALTATAGAAPKKGPQFPVVPEAGATPYPGAERLTYRVGPLDVTSGQNRIVNKLITEKPDVDGWITRFKPNLVYADGTVPKSNIVMFHHGVWINLSRRDATTGGMGQRMFATGEEKTISSFPKGYGYHYKASDKLLLNYMIHNLQPKPMTLYIDYEIDFIPDTAPEAAGMTAVEPVWMDVQNGSGYPVFDVHKGSGENGKFTYPADDPNAYPTGVQKNVWQVPTDGVLISTAGHVHSGGLSTDLYLRRTGGHYQGPDCRSMDPAGRKNAVSSALRPFAATAHTSSDPTPNIGSPTAPCRGTSP